ncbi:MAG: hypothetical protein NTX98_02805 [Candidatus Doudnabacteria bacterium]|nr:hypothetical protein [Candidatus Doudnabacteria bacterium]
MSEFDKHAARERHDEIIRDAQRIRDGLTKDVIDYYYDSYPESEEEEREQEAEMRRYLNIAHDRLNDLLNRLR